MKTLKNLFLDELADMYDAEHRIAKALPKMAKVATCTHLQEAFNNHLTETEGHAEKLESIFELFGAPAKSQKCHATVGLIDEAEEIISDNKGEPTINAALIAAAQKVEHYEIASYGTLREWANLLGNQEAADILQSILDEEFAANQLLTEIARSHDNEEALMGEGGDSSSGGMTMPSPRGVRPARTSRAGATK